MFFCIIAIYYDCPIHIIFFIIPVEIIITILIIAVNMILNDYLRLRHAHISIRHLIDKVTLQDLIQFISRKRHQQWRYQCYHHCPKNYQYWLPWPQIVGPFDNIIDRVKLNPNIHVNCRKRKHPETPHVEITHFERSDSHHIIHHVIGHNRGHPH